MRGEEREINFAILSVLPKMRVVLEVILAGMFQNKDAVIVHHTALKDPVGQQRQVLQCVGRIGEYDVETLVSPFQEVENISAYHMNIVDAELVGRAFDKVGTRVVDVDASHLLNAPRYKLEAHRASARKEVENSTVLEIDIVVQDVEQTFTSHIRSRSHRQIGGRVKSASSKVASYNSHIISPVSSYDRIIAYLYKWMCCISGSVKDKEAPLYKTISAK